MIAETADPVARGSRMRFCSLVAREQGEDPIGTALATERMVAVEAPLPWPTDFTAARTFPPGLAEIVVTAYEAHPTWGFEAIAPDPAYSRPGWTRVIDLEYPAPPRAAARRAEFFVRPARVAEFVATRLARDESAATRAGAEEHSFAGRDLLVCTHGTVDACCARFGYPLYRRLRALAVASDVPVRVWRASHFGGHRFAPTLLDLPEGRYWGFLSEDLLRPLLLRDGEPARLRGCYRGWAGYAEPEAQLLEREALIREGWAWTTWPQAFVVLDRDDEGQPARVGIVAHPPGGPAVAYEGRVEAAGAVETLFETDGESGKCLLQRIVDLRRWLVIP